jgi:signal transduction histidine kinase
MAEGRAPIDLAHELRTPLHTIRTAADLVLSGDAGPISGQAAGLVGEIARAARRLEVVTEMLLAEEATLRPSANGGGPVSAG